MRPVMAAEVGVPGPKPSSVPPPGVHHTSLWSWPRSASEGRGISLPPGSGGETVSVCHGSLP